MLYTIQQFTNQFFNENEDTNSLTVDQLSTSKDLYKSYYIDLLLKNSPIGKPYVNI